MRSLFAGLVLLAAYYCPAWADATIVGPDKVQRDKMGYFEIKGAAPNSWIIWDFDEEKLDTVEIKPMGLRVVGPPGSYRLKVRILTQDKDGNRSSETVRLSFSIVEGPTPPPPPPIDPVPDPFMLVTFKAAYNANTEADKEASMKGIASLYAQGATAAQDARIKTYKDLYDTMKSVATSLKLTGKIANVQQSIQKVATEAGVPSGTSDPIADRAKIADVFTKISVALRAVR